MNNLHFLFEYAGDRILQPISRKLHPGGHVYNLHFLFEYAGDRVLQPIFRKLHPGADLQNGYKKLKITVEYDFSSFCTNYAPPSFGMG